MAHSDLRLLKHAAIHWSKSEIERIPDKTRGLYLLYEEDGSNMNVVYVGIARGLKTGIKGRLKKNAQSIRKTWTHFSAYEVHDNISQNEVEEIEAFFLTAYAKDAHANKLNIQRGNKKAKAGPRRDEKRLV